jgi:hypothetical protein
VLATAPHPPPLLIATEAWPPNVEVAARNLRPRGGVVVAAGDSLPFRAASFEAIRGPMPRRQSAGTGPTSRKPEHMMRSQVMRSFSTSR